MKATQGDCELSSEFQLSGRALTHTARPGNGLCVSQNSQTLPDQLDAAGAHVEGYMEDMGEGIVLGKTPSCRAFGASTPRKPLLLATVKDQYR